MRISDWSSDVCSSDLPDRQRRAAAATAAQPRTVRAGSRALGAIAAGRRCDGLSGAGAGAVQESLVSRGARSDVAVVGGGVVGAACALALAGLDLDVTLVEARSEERRVGKEGFSTCKSRLAPC